MSGTDDNGARSAPTYAASGVDLDHDEGFVDEIREITRSTLRPEILSSIGGIPDVPVMEDLDLVQRMKRAGRLALLAAPAVTSARRYRAGGPLRTMLRHWFVAAAWSLGVDRRRIAQWAGR